MILLKNLLSYILTTTNTQNLIIEVYADKTAFDPEENFNFLVKVLVNAYNLMEPGHNKNHPLVNIEFLFPRVFSAESILLKDHTISQVYFNSGTDPKMVQ